MNRIRALLNRYPNLIFWSSLLLLNLLLYVPYYGFFRNEAGFFPLAEFEAASWRESAAALLLSRENADIGLINWVVPQTELEETTTAFFRGGICSLSGPAGLQRV